MVVPGNPRAKGHKRKEGDEFIAYPDAGVICGQVEYYRDDPFTIANPVALFEVLSPSTQIYDHHTKAEQYKKIPSLAYYVMIDSEQVRVEYRKRVDQATWIEFAPLEDAGDTLSLSLTQEIMLSLAALYEGVDFGDEE